MSLKWNFCGVVAQWCNHFYGFNPLNLESEQLGRRGAIPGRASPFEHHDKGSRTRLALSYFCDASVWC